MEFSSRTVVATQYTGGNAADVLAMCQMITQFTGNLWSIESDDGTTLVLRETSQANPPAPTARWPVAAGLWVVVAPDFGIIARISDDKYKARYRALSGIIGDAVTANTPSIVAAMLASPDFATATNAAATAAAKVEAGKAMYGGFGTASLPALLLNASANVPVTVTPTQKDTGYVARAYLTDGVKVLTAVSVTDVVKTSTSVVTVTVKSMGVIHAGGGMVLVHLTAPTDSVLK